MEGHTQQTYIIRDAPIYVYIYIYHMYFLNTDKRPKLQEYDFEHKPLHARVFRAIFCTCLPFLCTRDNVDPLTEGVCVHAGVGGRSEPSR